ncbi:MAG: ferritin family protein [Pseudomonadota bacterium]
MLAGRGFREVYSLAGGIKAWNGLTAAGPLEQGLGLLSGQEDRAQLLAVAHGLEAGLAGFYRQAGPLASDQRAGELCQRLARAEDGHQERVYGLYRQAGGGLERAALAEQASAQIMEGGEEVGQALARLFPRGFGAPELLETAMGIEAQALDLYLRMSHKLGDEPARQALYDLAQEEKAHLQALGQMLERVAAELPA